MLALRRLVRALALALLRTVYRIRASGLEHLPVGGALLVANHLSHVDALVLGTALARREARFLMHRSFFSIPLLGAFSKWTRATPAFRSCPSPSIACGAACSASRRAVSSGNGRGGSPTRSTSPSAHRCPATVRAGKCATPSRSSSRAPAKRGCSARDPSPIGS